jgi:uncharacterized protein YjbJ (UPF0337 family)
MEERDIEEARHREGMHRMEESHHAKKKPCFQEEFPREQGNAKTSLEKERGQDEGEGRREKAPPKMKERIEAVEEEIKRAVEEYEKIKETVERLKVVNSLLHEEVCKEYKELERESAAASKDSLGL